MWSSVYEYQSVGVWTSPVSMESLSVSDVLYAIGVQFDVLKVIVDLVFSTVMMLDFVVLLNLFVFDVDAADL